MMGAAIAPLPAAHAARPNEPWYSRWGLVLLAVPAVVLLAAVFVMPGLRLLSLAFADGSLTPFARALGDPLYRGVLWQTLLIGAYVTIACVILGYPVAYALATMPARWAAVGFVFLLLPFWSSVLVRTYAWMVLLGRNGVINQALLGWGWIDAPLPLLNNLVGVLIGMVHVLLPYMVFPIYSVMRRIDPNLSLAAQGLGGGPVAVFTRIYFPLTLPGLLAGSTLVFILAVGFYITPALLGGGRVMMIANLIERQVREFLDWGFAAALAAVLLAAVALIYVGLRRLLKAEQRWY
jgi:ABC-type spermidine/putrescine transport system permease subunit I